MNAERRSAIIDVASDRALHLTFTWLCQRRVDYADSSDVWNVRFRWAALKPWLQEELLAGRYRFSPVRRFRREGEYIELWASLDAVVLKALAIVLNRRLGFAPTCYHLAGQDGEERTGPKLRCAREREDRGPMPLSALSARASRATHSCSAPT